MREPLPATRWATVERVFLAAVALPPPERDSFVDTQCGDDRELCEEVLALLRNDSRGEDTVFAAVGQEVFRALEPEPLAGRTLGPWRIERELGRGGMSVVYLGSRADGEFRKSVAIKLIKRGMDTDAVIARMRRERGILAALDHPCISRLLDGGTTDDGLPWIAMEYVEGAALDVWCEQNGLGVTERCELIIKVSDAVAYAHRNLVVHGDIKPGNILVGTDGNPRLLDFGIAKLLSSEEGETSAVGPLTRGLMRPFTPEYASPEQLAGAPIGTATDVYSLGATLYELLTGVRPRPGAEPASTAALRARKGKRWVSRLRGDLDVILQTALRTEPERRYISMSQFALDLRRSLEGLPVSARADTLHYRAAKFVRRNRLAVAAAAAVVAALTGGVVVTTREAHKAQLAQEAALKESALARTERDRARSAEQTANQERNTAVAERQRADTEAATAKAVSDFLENDLLGQASPNAQAGQDLKVRTALDRAAERIEGKFPGKPLVEADIRSTIGESYNALGLYADAQKQYEHAAALRRAALGERNRDTLDSLTSIAVLERLQGKLDEAEKLYDHILDIQRAEFGEKDSSTLLTMTNLAVVYSHQQKYARSLEFNQKALAIEKSLLGPESIDTLRTMNNIGVDYTKLGRYDEAERLYRQILEIRRRVQGPAHPNTIFTANNLAVVYGRIGGKPAEAEKLYRETLDVQQRILGADHPDTLLTMNNLGLLWTQQPDKYADAEDMLTRSAEARARVLGAAHQDTMDARLSVGIVQILERKYPQAESTLRPLCDAYAASGMQVWQRYSCEATLGEALAGQKRYADAEPLLIAGYQGMRQREAAIPAVSKHSVGRIAEWLARLYQDQGKTELAEQWKKTADTAGK